MRKFFHNVALIIVLVIGLYWAKCQLGIDILPHFKWETEFPILNALQKREVILKPRPGAVVLRATFDEIFPNMPWAELWMRDEGMVKDKLVRPGVGGSKCLLVRSSSPKDWSLGHQHLVAVKPGEVFAYSAQVRTQGEASGVLGVILFDKDRNVLRWVYGSKTIHHAPEWRAVSSSFLIPGDTYYIRFRLIGEGVGDVYFDDVCFSRER